MKLFRCTGWEILPYYVPYEANVQLIKMFVQRWADPSHQCFAQVQGIIDGALQDQVNEHFGRFPLLKQHIVYVTLDRSFLTLTHVASEWCCKTS